jgi:hypothetical protein
MPDVQIDYGLGGHDDNETKKMIVLIQDSDTFIYIYSFVWASHAVYKVIFCHRAGPTYENLPRRRKRSLFF